MAKFSASASSDRPALQLGYHPSNHGHPSPASRLDSQNDVRHAQLLPEAVRLDAVDAVNVTGIVLHNAEFELSKLIPCCTQQLSCWHGLTYTWQRQCHRQYEQINGSSCAVNMHCCHSTKKIN